MTTKTRLDIGTVPLKILSCAYCGDNFTDFNTVFQHYDKIHSDGIKVRAILTLKNIMRKKAVVNTSDEQEAINFISRKTSEELLGFLKTCQQCPFCLCEIKGNNYMYHILSVHYWNRISKRGRDRGKFICFKCKKEFAYQRNLAEHQRFVKYNLLDVDNVIFQYIFYFEDVFMVKN